MKKLLFLSILLLSSCMQSSLSYIKAVNSKPLFTIEQILGEAGLIDPVKTSKKELPPTKEIPNTALNGAPLRKLSVINHTLEIQPGTQFTLKIDTKNRLIGTVFYASSGFIYQANESNPSQGKFIFQAGKNAGEIRIRLYNKDGSLSHEEKWFIEIRVLDQVKNGNMPN